MNKDSSPPLQLNWGRAAVTLSNTGHSVAVAPESVIETTVRSNTYTLQECHFRVGSEHTLGSEQQAMETQCVHVKQAVGGTQHGVVGILWKLGDTWNPFLASIEDFLPQQSGAPAEATINFDLLFDDQDNTKYWNYAGSLTTPPCTEEVDWYVLMNRLTLTQAQQDTFANAIGWGTPSTGGNFRPPQSLGQRSVTGCDALPFSGGCDCVQVSLLDDSVVPAQCGTYRGDPEPWCYVNELAENCGASARVIPSTYIDGLNFKYCAQASSPEDIGEVSLAWRRPAAMALAMGAAIPLLA